MRTTLEIVCACFGWQGGTIHQAREEFVRADLPTKNRVCSKLSGEIRNISDPEVALWFVRERNASIGLKIQGVQS